MKRVLPILLVLAVLGAGVSFFVAPLVAFGALRSAAAAEDVAGLAKLVDFDAVRASLAPQLDAKPGVQAPAPSVFKDPLGAFKRAIEPMAQAVQAPAGPQPDDYLTPRAMTRLTEGAGRDAFRSPAAGETVERNTMPKLAHWGVNRTRLQVGTESNGVTTFTFERRGPYEWKLVHVGLPGDETKAPPVPVVGKSSQSGG